jgi:hypothetical protein
LKRHEKNSSFKRLWPTSFHENDMIKFVFEIHDNDMTKFVVETIWQQIRRWNSWKRYEIRRWNDMTKFVVETIWPNSSLQFMKTIWLKIRRWNDMTTFVIDTTRPNSSSIWQTIRRSKNRYDQIRRWNSWKQLWQQIRRGNLGISHKHKCHSLISMIEIINSNHCYI